MDLLVIKINNIIINLQVELDFTGVNSLLESLKRAHFPKAVGAPKLNAPGTLAWEN